VWFKGDLESAQAEAMERNTVVMIEFYTDWCNWCRRLETDTFSNAEVQQELRAFVPMQLNAEKGGAELAERFGVDTYPTMVFLDASGYETDRILGYLPPDRFLRRVKRVRAGDTFLACLRALDQDPGDIEAIERSVAGLLERSDPEGAIGRIEAFHQATDGEELEMCRKLMFAARGELHARVYQRAAKLYRAGWERAFEVPDTDGTATLHRAIADGLQNLPSDEQATILRRARFEDAGVLLDIPDIESASPPSLLEIAGFAFRNGHFDRAADLYVRWYESEGDAADPANLNDVAWRLYLSGQRYDSAVEIAQHSYASNPDPETADTLARLLYVQGAVDEAIKLETQAAESAQGTRSETYSEIARRMEAGEALDDRPTFESYPGKRRRAL
jgi:thioredoxin-like negative regulator of GroEL